VPVKNAAWIPAKYGQLEVGPAPYTPAGEDQIVVRNHAVAINPLDWIIQLAGPVAYRWLTYPTVLGSDVAGEVVEGRQRRDALPGGRPGARPRGRHRQGR
jgi:NADPH:quinone reductase-like Zn-dependent oxidoreductase